MKKSSKIHNNAIASAISGCIGRGIVQPLDVIKIRLQLQIEPIKHNKGKYSGIVQAVRCIYKEEGIRALWKGHLTGQIHAVSFSIVQFYVFNLIQKNNQWGALTTYKNFVFGSISGMVGIIMTHPLDVLRTRFVAQGEPRIYNSMNDAVTKIIRQEGVKSLYKGLTPNVLLIAPQTGLQFFFYGLYNNLINKILQEQKEIEERGFIRSIFCGGLAGMTAKTIVYPLDLMKKRMQVQGFEVAREKFGQVQKFSGLYNGIKTTIMQEGSRSIFKGLSPSLLKAFLSIGLKFSVYEACIKILSKKLDDLD